jgi:hypothetical protein
MKRMPWIILSIFVAFTVAFASPLTVLAQDGGEETPTEEPVTSSEPTSEEATEEANIANYCVVDSAGVSAPCVNYSTLSGAISGGLGATLGDGFSLIVNILSAVVVNESVVIDGAGLTMDSFSLIGLGTTSAPTTVNGSITIQNFNTNSVNVSSTFGGLIINGGLAVTNSEADVNISGVNVENGEDSENGEGIYVSSITGDVTIENSQATSYYADGIVVGFNTGSVTLNDVVVYHSGGDGISITKVRDEDVALMDGGSGGVGNVTLIDVISNGNDGDGLSLNVVEGDLSISNSIFSGNDYLGIDVYEVGGNTTLTQVTTEYNDEVGMELYTGGIITLDHVYANNNWGDGALIGPYDGYEPPEGFSVGNDIRITDSTFSNNFMYGLIIVSEAGCSNPCLCGAGCDEVPSASYEWVEDDTLDGDVHLVNVEANNNGMFDEGEYSPYYDTPSGIEIYVESVSGQITLDNVTANNNGGYGMIMESYYITANNIQANGNFANPVFESGNTSNGFETPDYPYFGEFIFTCAQFNDNGRPGLSTYGHDVTLNGVEVIGNYSMGYPDPILYNYGTTDTSNMDNTAGCGWTTETETGTGLTLTDIVIEVMTDEVTGSGSITATQGLVFKLMEELTDGQKDLLARVAIPPSAAPTGTTFTFSEVSEGTPAALSDGLSYVGHSFTIEAVSPDGSQLNNINSYMELLFKVDPNFTAPAGTHLAIVHYNEETGEWNELSTGFSNGYAYAYSALTGAYALVTVNE